MASSPEEIVSQPRELRSLVHRIDRRLIVTTGILYSVSIIDRVNLGAASIAGMTEDLGLDVGYRYVRFSIVRVFTTSTNKNCASQPLHSSFLFFTPCFNQLPLFYVARLVLAGFSPQSL